MSHGIAADVITVGVAIILSRFSSSLAMIVKGFVPPTRWLDFSVFRVSRMLVKAALLEINRFAQYLISLVQVVACTDVFLVPISRIDASNLSILSVTASPKGY